MMSYMIFHHDVPFRCISPAVYEYLVTGDLDKAARLSSVLDVPDWEIREVISKLNDIKTVEDLRTFLLENPNVRDVMNVAGWVKDITVTNKGYAAMNLLIHEVLTKRKFAMDQIRRGLDCLEVLSLIQKYPDEMKEYFVKADKADITPDVMIREVFANANGKEDSQEKEQARKFFVQSLDVLYDDQKDDGMRKVLMYATARNSIPPLGFEEKIQLDYRSDGSSTFFAETCLLKLQVPVVFDSLNEFYKQFIFAVENGYKGFGCV
ncbi:G2/M phase-specific E3 ubiquitin-protein ligase-like [Montipora capricornis]|uniref:G2/M phase-specific E3 ubiquitin-protein ligase-like n=1 Tax=Montipora capricornis TaxID=246305 RepID=UPI0035F1C9F2